jgi:hypothetical protein
MPTAADWKWKSAYLWLSSCDVYNDPLTSAAIGHELSENEKGQGQTEVWPWLTVFASSFVWLETTRPPWRQTSLIAALTRGVSSDIEEMRGGILR